MKIRLTYTGLLILISPVLLLSSCNYTKHLAHNQTLIYENTVKLQTDVPIKYKGETESVILSLINPKANSHLFDLSFLPKYKLWRYNQRYALYRDSLTHPKLLRHKVEPPALLDSNQIRQSEAMIRQYMDNLGYFYAQVSHQVLPRGKKQSEVIYQILTGKRYLIEEVNTLTNYLPFEQIVAENSAESFLVKGQPFTKINCGSERDRLYKIIRNYGYYDFKADNIQFKIDTINRQRIRNILEDPFGFAAEYQESAPAQSLRVNLHIVQTRDSTFSQVYKIRKVKVNLHTPGEADIHVPMIHNELHGVEFSYKQLPVNRNVITRNIFIQSGSVYNTRDYEQTINRLNQLGVFQLVNISFEKVSHEAGQLDCILTLHTAPRMDLVTLLDLSTSDDDYFLGLGGGITFRNKNLAHGANLLSIRTSYSTEFRNDEFLTGTKKFYQSGNNVNLSANLTSPKFIVPFNQNIFSKRNMPFTTLGTNYSFIQRINNYTFINLSGSFGYTWQETQKKNWRVNPVFLTVTQVPDRFLSDEFREKRKTNSYLRNTFANNVIQGENMLFEYRGKPKRTYGSFVTLKIGLEEAGTLMTGLNALLKNLSSDSILAIARYVKTDWDFRKYVNRRKSQWASRIMIGVGVPFGASRTLPFMKQYSAGGAFSNRGWQARSLGPGRSVDNAFQSGFVILDKTGDMKFEANTEFRFDLLKLFSGAMNLKGATFLDMGNIWLMKKDTSIAGGEFNPRYLWQDIAMSAGLGLRLDFSFFVFRLDYGYPFKQPQIPTDYGFVFDRLKLTSGLVNLGLGYPF